MKRVAWLVVLAMVLGAAACGEDGEPLPPPDLQAWVHLEVGLIEEFDIDYQTVILDGSREVTAIDTEFREGIEAIKVLYRQNNNLIATRWYQTTDTQVLLLGEEVVEGMQVVTRTFLTPIQVLPYPLVNQYGQLVQNWSTTSDMEEGGSETHRFDNGGLGSVTVPAGSYQAYHLVHTRTDAQAGSHQLDEYFVPDQGFVRFEYPEGEVWSLRPATP